MPPPCAVIDSGFFFPDSVLSFSPHVTMNFKLFKVNEVLWVPQFQRVTSIYTSFQFSPLVFFLFVCFFFLYCKQLKEAMLVL